MGYPNIIAARIVTGFSCSLHEVSIPLPSGLLSGIRWAYATHHKSPTLAGISPDAWNVNDCQTLSTRATTVLLDWCRTIVEIPIGQVPKRQHERRAVCQILVPNSIGKCIRSNRAIDNWNLHDIRNQQIIQRY